MQGLVLSAYPRHVLAKYLLLRIENVAAARAWLGRLLAAGAVTRAFRKRQRSERPAVDDERLRQPNLNLAFTASGLALLGGRRRVDDALDVEALTDALPGFSFPFVEGLATGLHRRWITGGIGDSEPEQWEWGGWQSDRAKRVDVLVCVFAPGDQQALAAAVERFAPPGSAMTDVVDLLPTLAQTPGDTREHFGFPDGISQPILSGSVDAERCPESQHLTAVGEIVCGYPDGAGILNPAPGLGGLDGNFGRNGSYLVFCQFHQDVAAFRRQMMKAAGGDEALADAIAAKIIGRRKDTGAPLVPYTTRSDNEFSFAEDPYGFGCPIGAHIRRTNPRDSFLNNNETPTAAITRNRHRILRRGRAYGERLPEHVMQDDGRGRGLFFMCLNADIERQFEFVMQNWVNNPAFFGLRDECDPLIGRGERHAKCPFTIPMLPAPARVVAEERFVRIVGGQYFFMPGLTALEHLAGER
jgi:Dyp-type peroxidase family